MAPEQFTGHDADAISDIFSYGLMFYQFVSGSNPFEGRDPGSIIYKITTVEPSPLSEVVGDCPRALDHIVARAMAKDPAFRYQSFADLLLDLQPVLLHLRKEKSSELLSEANKLLQSGQPESAARKVLNLDPANQEARKLLELVQQSLQQLSARERIEANIVAVDNLIDRKQFFEASSALESALALYPENPEIIRRLDSVRRLQEQERLQERSTSGQLANESGGNADRTVLVDPKIADLPPPAQPSEQGPSEFTRFFSKVGLDPPLNASITVISCPDPFREGQTIDVTAPRFTIGRTGSDLSIPEDKTLSRSHAVIAWNGAGFTIQDAGTPNGTYLNGARLEPAREVLLPLIAEIRLSLTTRLRFRCEISELPDFTGQIVAGRYTLVRCLRAGRKSALYEGSDARPIRKVAVPVHANA